VRYQLQHRATERAIEAIVLEPDDDLRALAEGAVARGADVIGMAGGDGSQAIVASVAASHGIAYVCVPAGTRNHFALDLGVDRNDVVGALDAYGPAQEVSVDLASVNGRTFVNNVSLGLYAIMVESKDYRDQKAKTALDTLEERIGPGAPPFDLHVDGPDGPIDDPQIVQVSNNPYVLTSLRDFGTRPRLDTGRLGVVTARVDGRPGLHRLLQAEHKGQVGRLPGLHEWTTPAVEVRSSSSVPAGIDGESVLLRPPLRFECLPTALRVRLAHAPVASPAVRRSPLRASMVSGLLSLVRGRPSGLV
jgi:diacylglycerol kinase family enzyme